ncbi:MAG: sugar phosphate isomerase/epimerase [Proteobacteria bacterium]|nr:sugar phosphate isomerase/epimerase [Pseudomonadota bacterium]
MFLLGYNTNGFNCHCLKSTLEIIAGLGYRCVAITLDHCALNPYQPDLEQEIESVKGMLKQYDLSCVIETGARFLLDPWHKHEPTLISGESKRRKYRLDFLKKAVNIGAKLDAKAISFWSGKKSENVDDENAWKWLVSGCRELSACAEKQGIPLAFEPEPGMFIETLYEYQKLKKDVGNDIFGLTLDLGHAFLTEKAAVGESIRMFRHDIKNIHIEDMKKGKHEHLFFGEGDMNFPEIFHALKETSYNGPVNVELSRHSHDAVEVAKKARDFLLRIEECWNVRMG